MKSTYNVKTIINSGLTLLLLAGMFQMISCGDDPVPETERVSTILTSHKWNTSSVTVNGVQSSLFTGFSITFTATGFTTTNGAPVWPASGTWTFKDESAKVIVRNDGMEIKLNEVNDASLKLELTWNQTTIGPGRTSSIAGIHVFSMGK